MNVTRKIKKSIFWLFETIPGLGLYLALVSVFVFITLIYGAFPYSLWVVGSGVVVYVSKLVLNDKFQFQNQFANIFRLFIGHLLLIFSCGILFGFFVIGWFQFLNSKLEYWLRFDWAELEWLLALRYWTSVLSFEFLMLILTSLSLVIFVSFVYQIRNLTPMFVRLRWVSSFVFVIVVMGATFSLGSKTIAKEWTASWVKGMKETSTWSSGNFPLKLFADALTRESKLRQQVLTLVPHLFEVNFDSSGTQIYQLRYGWKKEIDSCIESEVVNVQFKAKKQRYKLESIENFSELQQYRILEYYLELEHLHSTAFNHDNLNNWLAEASINNQIDIENFLRALRKIATFTEQHIELRSQLTEEHINRLDVYHLYKTSSEVFHQNLTAEFAVKATSLLKNLVRCKQIKSKKGSS